MKLSGWTIVVIGLCLGLSALSYALFQVYMPYEQAAAYNEEYKGQLIEARDKLPRARKRVEKAMAMVEQAANQWNQYVATKTPPASLAARGINLNVNPIQLTVDAPKFRNNAQREFNAQLRVGGVKIVSAPQIPDPTDSEREILASYFNYPAFNFPVVLWELGNVTVQGNYRQIMTNVKAWSNMPHYLAVVDGLQINGTSPNLTASYNVTLVGFIRATEMYPGIPDGPLMPATNPAGTPAATPGQVPKTTPGGVPGGKMPAGGGR
jgi:hypothetical protein